MKKDKNLVVFILFFKVYNWCIEEKLDGIYVIFIDLCYCSNGYYLFVVVVKLDDDLKIVLFYIGWIFFIEKLYKKLVFVSI